MNLFIILLILIANVVAYFLIFHSLGKEMESDKRIKTALIIIGAMYLITLVIYYLSGIGIGKFEKSESFRNYLMMAFVPVNLIIIVPYSIHSFMKTKKGKLNKKILNQRLLVIEIIALLILIIEFFYFRSAQKNMKKMAEEAQNATKNQETVEKNEEKNNNEINNTEINNNEINNNTISNNTINNNETNNEIEKKKVNETSTNSEKTVRESNEVKTNTITNEE